MNNAVSSDCLQEKNDTRYFDVRQLNPPQKIYLQKKSFFPANKTYLKP